MRKKRKRSPVPRLGPPVNLRPAGAHVDKRRESRQEQKAALKKLEAAFERIGVAAP